MMKKIKTINKHTFNEMKWNDEKDNIKWQSHACETGRYNEMKQKNRKTKNTCQTIGTRWWLNKKTTDNIQKTGTGMFVLGDG